MDEAENPQRVHIIAQGQAIATDQGFGSPDMGPTGLGLEEIRIQKLSAAVVQGADENPFFLGIGRPEIMRSIVLDERSN